MVSAGLGKLPLQCLPSTKFTKSLILFRKGLTELSISSEMVVAAPEIKKAIRTPNGCGSREWGWGPPPQSSLAVRLQRKTDIC